MRTILIKGRIPGSFVFPQEANHFYPGGGYSSVDKLYQLDGNAIVTSDTYTPAVRKTATTPNFRFRDKCSLQIGGIGMVTIKTSMIKSDTD